MIDWLIDTLIVTGALIAAVLVLRRPVARMFGPGVAYALWLLPVLRLLLPPLVLPASMAPVRTAEVRLVAIPGPVAAEPGLPLAAILLALWLGGALAYLAWRGWSYAAMRRALLDRARPMGEAGRVRIVESPLVTSPVAFGIFDKVIALPIGFMARPDREARDLAIAHELEHHRGHDLAANLAVQPLLALHWFNPLAWAAWRAMRRDQEAACDARVVAGRDAGVRETYGRLIASFAGGPGLVLAAPIACPVLGEKSVVHRLRSLTMRELSGRRRLIGRGLIGAMALALPATASISYAADEPQVAPAPPAPPAPPSPPAPEAKPQVHKRIVIIEREKGDRAGDARLQTRVFTRDNKTIVIKSDKPLTDADVEERIGRLESENIEESLAVADRDAGEASTMVMVRADAGDRANRRRIVIRDREGTGEHAEAIALPGGPVVCADGVMTRSESAGEGGRGPSAITIVCGNRGGKAQAIDGIRRVRQSISEDANLSDTLKDRVLKALDEQIERLSKDG